MRRRILTPRRALLMACLCVCLVPRATAAAQPSLAIDFDGDGRHDHIMLDGRQPSLLHVWLSASGTTQVLRTHSPLQNVVATDLDGDHRPELIARDSESRIHVWTPRGTRFHRYRRQHGPDGLTSPTGHRIDDLDEEPASLITGSTYAPSALLRITPRGPPTRASRAVAPQGILAFHGSPAVQPFAPRPPPASLPL